MSGVWKLAEKGCVQDAQETSGEMNLVEKGTE